MYSYKDLHNDFKEMIKDDDGIETIYSIISSLIVAGLYEGIHEKYSVSSKEYSTILITDYAKSLCYNKDDIINRFMYSNKLYNSPMKKWIENFHAIAKNHPHAAEEKYKKHKDQLTKYFNDACREFVSKCRLYL